MPSILTRPLGRLLAACAVVILVALGWFALQVDPIFSSAGKEVIVTVHPGDSLDTIVAQLRAKGVVASPLAFRIYTLFGAPVVQPGSYGIAQHSSFANVKAILGSAPNIINVIPGLTLHEVALNVANAKGAAWANSFVKAATNDATQSPFAKGSSLEGLIGAGQYIIAPGTTAAQLARRMVDGFVKEASSVGLTPSTTLNGLDAYNAGDRCRWTPRCSTTWASTGAP
jgi:cell division protein YceG involved in septum cleavage